MPDSANARPPRPAVFLDRDGTIAEETGYLNHISRFRMFPFTPRAIYELNRAGWPVVVVTNQSGIALKFFPESLVHDVHGRMIEQLAAPPWRAHLDAIYFCPHGSADKCSCAKPRMGMFEQAARDLNLELKGSWVVSDRYRDLEQPPQYGMRTILVLTGYGRGEYEWNRPSWPRRPDYVVENLADAVDVILGKAAGATA